MLYALFASLGLQMHYYFIHAVSVMNQTLGVNELTRAFYDTAHYNIGKCVVFMVIINVVNFAAQLLGKP